MIRATLAIILLATVSIGAAIKAPRRLCDVGYIGTVFADGAVTCRRAP